MTDTLPPLGAVYDVGGALAVCWPDNHPCHDTPEHPPWLILHQDGGTEWAAALSQGHLVCYLPGFGPAPSTVDSDLQEHILLAVTNACGYESWAEAESVDAGGEAKSLRRIADAVLVVVQPVLDRQANEIATERAVYADSPGDRLWHDADRTWWRRAEDGRLVRADAPPEVEQLRSRPATSADAGDSFGQRCEELGRIPAGRYYLTIGVEVGDDRNIVSRFDVPGGVNIRGFWQSSKTRIEPAPISSSDTKPGMCPFGTNQCTFLDGVVYHSDCERTASLWARGDITEVPGER